MEERSTQELENALSRADEIEDVLDFDENTLSDVTVAEYLNHTRLVIMPMLSKLRAARCLLKTSAEYDILMSPEYDDLKVILDAIDDSHFGIADNESSGASMGESK